MPSSKLELVRELLAGEDAYLVGGAVRDELLGRDLVDLDIVCSDPKRAARAFAERSGGSPFPLSERHGAWRVVFPGGECVDFAAIRGSLDEDLALRDFTVNAMAEPLSGGEIIDPFGGRSDLAERLLRAVSDRVFGDDPLRLLRAVRFEEELGLRLDAGCERLVREYAGRAGEVAGERILAELERLSWEGYARLDELGLLAPLDGSLALAGRVDRALVDSPRLRLVAVFGENLRGFPISGELSRYSGKLLRARPPADGSAREIHRFRRATEPWSIDALAFLGAGEHAEAVQQARENDPEEPLLRGDELGMAPGPLVGELLDLIAEERAAGTISTRQEALALAERECVSRGHPRE